MPNYRNQLSRGCSLNRRPRACWRACQSMSNTYWAEPSASNVASAVGVRLALMLPETGRTPELFTYLTMRRPLGLAPI